MAIRLMFVCCLIAIVIAGCAPSPRQRLLDVSVGMSMEQVYDVLGDPARVSYKETYEAWLYEYKYMNRSNCRSSTPNEVFSCGSKCLHAIVWFNRYEVSAVTGAVTGAESDRLRYCGSGGTPIDWNYMPESAK